MNVAGIICEYNPIHNGHVRHLKITKTTLGEEGAIVCVMSGNFVQRGDIAVFSKHARAAAAIACGADLVLELPLPYVLSSAEGFARGGVALLNSLGIVTHLSFGSEEGTVESLREIAEVLLHRPELDGLIKKELANGTSYPGARQKAVARLLGNRAELLRTPNNNLGIEYLKALIKLESSMRPFTIRRTGAAHDSGAGESASALRAMLRSGEAPWQLMPQEAAEIYKAEIAVWRGPVFLEKLETAMLARLRMLPESAYTALPDATEGLGLRLMRFGQRRPTLSEVLEATKTKRYTLSRIRRMVMCACLGLTAQDSSAPPPYVRVLAMNDTGRLLLREIGAKTELPVIIKPAAAGLHGAAGEMFQKEAAATDFYVLAYDAAKNRTGGQEWTTSPRVM